MTLTPTDVEEVPEMSFNIVSNGTRITSRRVNSSDDLDIGGVHGHVIPASDPVLRAEVRIPVQG